MSSMYDKADKLLGALSKTIAAEFMRITNLRLDELNIVKVASETAALYERLLTNNRNIYLAMARQAYAAATVRATEIAGGPITGVVLKDSWVDTQLGQYNSVTGYLYHSEAERKRLRFAEQILTATAYKSRNMLDSSTRQASAAWWRQTAQYAIDTTDAATLRAYMDCGVTHVVWVSEQDERVCKRCAPLDDKVFPIEKAPPKQHWNCRCYLLPTKKEEG